MELAAKRTTMKITCEKDMSTFGTQTTMAKRSLSNNITLKAALMLQSPPADSGNSRTRGRWTKAEYQGLIDKVLLQYARVSSTRTPTHDESSQSCLRDGSEREDEARPALDKDHLDCKPAAHIQRQVSSPLENDVLFGRSKYQKNHTGNQYLRQLCDRQREAYDAADRDDKTAITRWIVSRIASRGGRFLKFEKMHKRWFEVNNDEARHKVAHLMRDGRAQRQRLAYRCFPSAR